MIDHNRTDVGMSGWPHDDDANPDCDGSRCPSCDCCQHCNHRTCKCPDPVCGCNY